jgi:CYTH domain-containing protein
MATEIERKFVPKNNDWKHGAKGVRYRQGYLSTEKGRTVRARTVADKGFLTIKGKTVGASRAEYEYEIPLQEANEILEHLCQRPLIEKTRYKIPHQGLTWEVDEFEGENSGLVIAEVELESEDQVFERPSWVGEEVTADARYYNANLISHPYCEW